MSRIKFGYKLPNCAGVLCEPEWVTVKNIYNLAELAGQLGFDTLWFHDHLLPPSEVAVTRPDFYEPLISISHLATRMPQMAFGVATLILPLRDPVLLARQLTTLGMFFPGRITMGVGVGRYKSEFESCGSDAFHRRGRMATEALHLIRALWESDKVDFEGEFYRVDSARHFPQAHDGRALPIWVGGNVEASIKRAAALGDGFMPAAKSVVELDADRTLLDRELIRLGRDPDSFPMGLSLTLDLRQTGEDEAEDLEERGMHGHARSRVVSGKPAQVAEQLMNIARIGVSHFALSFRANSLAQLTDRLELFATEVRPHI